jgi:hypothetical protein
MNAIADRKVPIAVQGPRHSGTVNRTAATNGERRRPPARFTLGRFVRTLRAAANTGLRNGRWYLAYTVIASLLLLLTLVFTTLMLVAIVTFLTCGLACYA